MSVAPDPPEIFSRAVEEGERRLDQSLIELLSTGFIAGFRNEAPPATKTTSPHLFG